MSCSPLPLSSISVLTLYSIIMPLDAFEISCIENIIENGLSSISVLTLYTLITSFDAFEISRIENIIDNGAFALLDQMLHFL